LKFKEKKKEEGPWTTDISKTLFCCSPSLHETVSLGQAIFGVCPFFLPDLLVDMASYRYDRRRLYRNELFPALHFLRDVIKGDLAITVKPDTCWESRRRHPWYLRRLGTKDKIAIMIRGWNLEGLADGSGNAEQN
jgi:hypothetical protein